ncbi:MAG: 50S ribosomal protein L32 [bacterium]|nr:50S ribosomal protein L32 [bacterium]
MALPKRRHSRSRTRMRRSHDGLSKPQVGACPECGEPKMLHQLCSGCGMYKNKRIVQFEEEL